MNSFRELVAKIEYYNEALALLGWDLRTKAPRKAAKRRSEVISALSKEVFSLSTSKEMGEYLERLRETDVYDELDEITRKTVDLCYKEYIKNVKIPEEEYREYVLLQAETETLWEEAKEKGDFEMFRPNLEKIVAFKKKFISYWGYDKHPYDRLLDEYEPGVFVDTIDTLFADLRKHLIPLVHGVVEAKKQPKTDFLYEYFPKEKQRAFSLHILNELGFDFSKGRLDESVHPFALGLNPNDVRITTKYNEHDFRVSIFGTIHECGHALYEQHLSEQLVGTPLCDGTSMGIHESQSLFWEKFIGQNYYFWKRNFDVLKKYTNQFEDVSLDAFYFAINEAKPSLIRIESDELTYCLHIILRYELEKALIEGNLQVKDLPGAWNDKMEQYLGIRPKNDGEGVLQDVHWSFGAFGYFPSYALGYIYAAQIKEALKKDVNIDEQIDKGEYEPIHNWLAERIYKHGKRKQPSEIIEAITGGGIDSTPLIRYLEEKYRKLYEF